MLGAALGRLWEWALQGRAGPAFGKETAGVSGVNELFYLGSGGHGQGGRTTLLMEIE